MEGNPVVVFWRPLMPSPTMPQRLSKKLSGHLARVRQIHRRDLSEGWGHGVLPHA
jgi:hypothetical protein